MLTNFLLCCRFWFANDKNSVLLQSILLLYHLEYSIFVMVLLSLILTHLNDNGFVIILSFTFSGLYTSRQQGEWHFKYTEDTITSGHYWYEMLYIVCIVEVQYDRYWRAMIWKMGESRGWSQWMCDYEMIKSQSPFYLLLWPWTGTLWPGRKWIKAINGKKNFSFGEVIESNQNRILKDYKDIQVTATKILICLFCRLSFPPLDPFLSLRTLEISIVIRYHTLFLYFQPLWIFAWTER